MTNWLKKNWDKIVNVLAILAVVYFIYLGIDGLIAGIKYKQQIKILDTEISELQQGIKDSKGREEAWEKSSSENYTLAMEKEAKLRKKDAEMRVKLAEKRALKKKIREMPVTQVIVRTIEIINCSDVVQQEQGIVFTLDCAKSNLTFLEASLFLEKERDDWKGQYSTCLGEVSDLKNVIITKNEAYAERGIQLTDAYGIIDNWEGKFTLSEKRGKQKYWRGFKKGGTIGGILGFLAGFFLGK